MEPKRVRVTPKGIKRSTPITASEDGNCSEIINMRFKDGAWRRVNAKSLANSYEAMSALSDYKILKRHPLMDKKYLVGVKSNKLYLINLEDQTETLIKDHSGSEGIAVEGTTNPEAIWGCSGVGIETSPMLLEGDQNTDNIIDGCATDNIAARVARAYTTNGYSDWYLPSLQELKLIYKHKGTIGNFSEAYYWSSTQRNEDDTMAYTVSFIPVMPDPNTVQEGDTWPLLKGQTARVRAIRKFNVAYGDTPPEIGDSYGGGTVIKKAEADTIYDIFFFSRIMIVSTLFTKTIYKLNEDENGYEELPELPEGQHSFWQTDDQPKDVSLIDGSLSLEDNLAYVANVIYEDRRDGIFEGHCFFRFAWRLFDNSLIKHSALHYHHVGFAETGISINGNSDPWVLQGYSAAKPKVKISFSQDELDAIEKYKGFVTGLVVYMSDPISNYKNEWTSPNSAAPYIYLPETSDSIDDLLSTIKGFYNVDEIGIDELLEMEDDASGGKSLTRVISTGDVNSVEVNERMELDSFSSHKIIGEVSYDYNSMIHIGNVATILSKSQNIAKYLLLFKSTGDKSILSTIYGANRNLLYTPINKDLVPQILDINVSESGYTTAPPNYVVLFSNYESGGIYDPSTGAYTVKVGYTGNYTISFRGKVRNGQEQEFETQMVVYIEVNGVAVKNTSDLIVYANESNIHEVDIVYSADLNQGDTIRITAIHYSDQNITPITDGVYVYNAEFSVGTSLSSSPYSFIPYIEATISTDDGDRFTLKEISQGDAYFDGLAMYYDFINETYTLIFKEHPSYPDLRATKLRILAYDIPTDTFHVLKTFDLVKHPYLDFAYAKPILVASGNYYYSPVKVTLPADITTLTTYTPKNIANVHLDKVYDKNRVQVSRINNPWLYPSKYSYRIGMHSNKVIQIATMSDPMSQGQYGEFPLKVFTEQGIFDLKQGNGEILYLSINRFNLDALTSKENLLELGGAIAYATETGVFIMSGNQKEEISVEVEGKVSDFTSDWRMPLIDIEEMEKMSDFFSDVTFKSYLQGAHLAFDNNEKEIYFINPIKPYSYVYQTSYNTWYKIGASYKTIIRLADNNFEAISEEGLVYKLSQEDENNSVACALLTRPMLLGDTELKKIERMVGRVLNYNDSGPMAVNIFASLDGINFEWLAGVSKAGGKFYIDDIIIKRTHTSARYFIISFGAVASETFELTAFDMEIQQKHQRKLR
jgi:hypothetical protein